MSRYTVALLVAAGCSPGEIISDSTCPTQQEQQKIINGVPDSDHPSVVALVDGGDVVVCSGTVIAVRGGVGHVLTAAHCPSQVVAVLGAERRYRTAGVLAHPAVEVGTGSDLAMVRILGVGDDLPVLTPLRPDEDHLVTGTSVEFVGYGEDAGGMVGRRARASGWLTGITPSTLMHRQSDGGPCHGDSGGPVLARVAGAPRIVGVTIKGDRACAVDGLSARVSAAYDVFIQPALEAPIDSYGDSSPVLTPPLAPTPSPCTRR
jgi:hypothetical protein